MSAERRWRVLIGSRSFGQADPSHIRQLEEAGCEVVPNSLGRAYREEELLELLPEMDAIITGTDELTARVIEAAGRLRTIAKHGVGLDNIDLEAARRRGIVVTATPGAIHDSVADLTMGLIIAVARQIVPAHNSTVAGEWRNFVGLELRDKTLGIIGLGRIGKGVCLRALPFGMRVVAYDLYPDEEFARAHGVRFVGLEELLATSDVVTLHASAGNDGRLLGRREIGLMKPGAIFINTSRGKLVDEGALYEALAVGRLAGAGLDVFEEEPPRGPLLELPNVVLTPHIAGQTREGMIRMGEMTVQNCLRALRGEEPLYRVV